MSGSFSLRGWNDPTPPAMKTVRARNSCAGTGPGTESTVLALELDELLAQVQSRLERRDLLHQRIDQPLPGAHRHGRYVIDGLVRIKPGALASGSRQRIDDFRMHAEQSQLEDLEEAAGTGPDDQRISLNGHGRNLKANLGPVRCHRRRLPANGAVVGREYYFSGPVPTSAAPCRTECHRGTLISRA